MSYARESMASISRYKGNSGVGGPLALTYTKESAKDESGSEQVLA